MLLIWIDLNESVILYYTEKLLDWNQFNLKIEEL